MDSRDRTLPPDPRLAYGSDHPWHVSINQFHDTLRKRAQEHPEYADRWPHRGWMYEAKDLSSEVPRMIQLFEMERAGKLKKIHQQCSMSEPVPVEDNHLTCCLGVKCQSCPELRALDAANIPDDERDKAKAWTCAAHILSEGGDRAKEGYLLTVDDRMFWERVYASLAMEPPDEGSETEDRTSEEQQP